MQLKRTRTEGHQPGIDQINTNTMVYNEADGLWYSKKRLPDGTESIVLIGGGSPPGTSDPHLRAHQIDSANDHPAVPAEKRNRWVHTNAETGEIELIEQGPQGDPGLTPFIGENGNWWIGDTDTGVKAAGTDGEDGDDGTTPHIGTNGNWWIGTTDTGVKAQGEDGEDGLTPYIGINGNWWIGTTDTGVMAEGVPGDSAYVYIAYASDASGTGFTLTFDANLDYIAILSTDTEILTPAVGDFAGLWKNYKGAAGADGADGADGSNGIDGDDGANAYLYIAYASDDQGADFSLTFNATSSNPRTYIAALTTTTPIATPIAANFTGLWMKFVGEDGTGGNEDLTHFTYMAWRDSPGTAFTLTPNVNLEFEAILVTHTELTSPVEADFAGLWRARVTPSNVHGIPKGGITGQVIKKTSNVDYEIAWQDESGGSGGSTELTAIPATDQTASGITTHFTANENQAFGDIVRINSAGKAQLAKADVIANATALAMCIADVLADATGEYLLLGFVRNDAWDWTVGEWIYLSLTGTTGNTLTQTSPFAADPIVENTVVQMVGVANTADTFYFNPQMVQVELKP